MLPRPVQENKSLLNGSSHIHVFSKNLLIIVDLFNQNYASFDQDRCVYIRLSGGKFVIELPVLAVDFVRLAMFPEPWWEGVFL